MKIFKYSKASTLLALFVLLVLSCKEEKKADAAPQEEEVAAALPEASFFEMRTYYCAPGRLDALQKRFRDHTMKLFEKHGITNLAYWIPLENPENKLVYIVGFPDEESRDVRWESFFKDPEWIKAYEASRADGPIVDSVQSVFLRYTDYSPKITAGNSGPRVFSQRTYYTAEGKLPNLHARFRDHTLKIFENNGMTNVAYFDLDDRHEMGDRTLIYFITFPDTTARSASWATFLEDPDWLEARANSIADGPILDSLKYELFTPTDFSPLK